MFTVMGIMKKDNEDIDYLVVNNIKYEWGSFVDGILPKTLKLMYLNNNRDVDGVFYFIQELAYGGEEAEEKLSAVEIMELRNKDLFYLYVITLIGYWALFTAEVDNKGFNDYTYQELFSISERDEFTACIIENMLDIFGEFSIKQVFPLDESNLILTGLDSQNKPIYKEGSNDIGQGDEIPKWVN